MDNIVFGIPRTNPRMKVSSACIPTKDKNIAFTHVGLGNTGRCKDHVRPDCSFTGSVMYRDTTSGVVMLISSEHITVTLLCIPSAGECFRNKTDPT